MKNFLRRAIVLITMAVVIVSCSQVFMTGRKQILLIDQGQITSLSNQAYTEIMSESKVSTNKAHINTVREVGFRITNAVERYVKEKGLENVLEGMTWKFDVIASDQVNAFCLPNGNIVFYEGIMKLTNTPDLVAVVMGHEIAHALAKHGNERMSQEMLLNTVGQAASAFIGENQQNKAIFQLAFGLGSQLGVVLPYSRKHEYEADRLGLIIMAMAGYDINVAPGFWERMSDGKGGTMEFFSTHPSDQNRIKQIMAVLPEAAKYAPSKR